MELKCKIKPNQNNPTVIAHKYSNFISGDHLLQLFLTLLFFNSFINKLDFPCGSAVNNLPAMQEM